MTMESIASKFVGTWELVEWRSESSDGKRDYPLGPDAIGWISYGTDGNMFVQIIRRDRPHFTSQDPLQGEPDEIVSAYTGQLAYCGSYTVDTDAGQVIHDIKISAYPNWVGQKQIRYYKLEGDTLTLSTAFIASRRHKLIWKRLRE